LNPKDFTRLANNFYNSKGLESNVDRIVLDSELVNYCGSNQKSLDKKFKVALVFICLNPLYWQYAPEMVQGTKEYFLPGHKTDFFFWTDIPENPYEVYHKISASWKERGKDINDIVISNQIQNISDSINKLRGQKDINIIPTEPVEWPYPTLLRYNLFLQEEHKLKDYDYVFYLDIDMKIVNIVGDEILPKEGLMAALHPMYALRKEYWPPYEPNPTSASYIKRPGQIISDGGKPRFMPLYFAGGFQGGKADKFIEAMKETRKIIEQDMNKGYVPIWNDESAWNKYLSENQPEIVLTPSYIYPDSLIKEYYEPLWGQHYQPKIITVTKWFTTSKEGGKAITEMLKK